jgi:hypothetical protein
MNTFIGLNLFGGSKSLASLIYDTIRGFKTEIHSIIGKFLNEIINNKIKITQNTRYLIFLEHEYMTNPAINAKTLD